MESGMLLGGEERRRQVFLEKSGEKKEVSVEKLEREDGPRFWFKDLKPDPPKEQVEERPDEQSVTEDAADESSTEEVIRVMSEVDPGEVETGKKLWLSEKATTLENENGDLKRVLREMEAKIELQGKTIAGMARRHGAIETTIAKIAEHVQRQIAFNEGVRASFTSVAEEVGKHQNNFREVVRILQAHEYIVRNGAASQEMAQRINALIEENATKTMWIGSLMRVSATDPSPSATPTWTTSPGRSDQGCGESSTTAATTTRRYGNKSGCCGSQ